VSLYVVPVLEALLLPPGLILVIGVIAVAFAFNRRLKLAAWLAIGDLSLLYLLSTVPVSNLLIEPLENRFPPLAVARLAAEKPDYVIVLGGGIIPRSPEEGNRGSMAPEALKRLVYAGELARRLDLPLITTGGIVPSSPALEPEAAVAARTLSAIIADPPKILLEDRSRNTWENAANVERRYHPKLAVLVTSAYHMPRSAIAFRRNHVPILAAPTDYLSTRTPFSFFQLLPGASSLRISSIALKEYLGILDYDVRR